MVLVALLLARWRPAEARCDGGLIVFALNHVLRAALVEAEDFVVHIQPVRYEAQAFGKTHAALGVHLKMGVEIDVAEGPDQPAWRAILELITIDVCLIVRESNAQRDAATVVGRTDVEGVRSCPGQPRMVGAARDVRCTGRRVAVVGREAKAAPGSWQRGKVLKVSAFKPANPGVPGVNRL